MFLIYFIPTLIIALFNWALAVVLLRENGARSRSDFRRVAVWSISIGFVSFLGGFLGPLYLWPESPQGPLLGIVISGPVGATVGCIAGAVRSLYLARHREPPTT